MKGTSLLNSLSVIYKAFYNKIKNPNSVLWQVSTVAGATVIAQALNVLVLPVLSRIYSTADFGVMSVYSSIITVLATISGLNYHLAIPLPKQNRYAHALVILSFVLQIIVVALVTIFLSVAGGFILEKLSMESLMPYKLLLPVGLFFIGIYNIASQWAIRESLFSTLGKTKITQSFCGAFIKIVMGIAGSRPLGLLIGTIAGQGSGIITLLRHICKNNGIPKWENSDIKHVLLRYRNFPIYSTLFSILNTIGINMPQLFLSSYFNTQITGLYSMANALLHIPSVFVGQALGQIFLQRASVAAHSGNLKQLAFNAYIILLKVGFFPTIFISIFAPFIFSFVLGAKWAASAEYAVLLAPWLAIAFVFSPLSMLYAVQNRQEIGLLTEVIYFILRLSSMWLGARANNPYLAVGLFSLSGAVLLSCRLIDILKSLGHPIRIVFLSALKIIVSSFALVSFPFLLLRIDANLMHITTSCVIVCFVYVGDIYYTLKKSHIL